MNSLPAAVRNKAIEIANALFSGRFMDEGIAIATAISRAKDWAINHSKSIKNKLSRTKKMDEKAHDEWSSAGLRNDWPVKVEEHKKKKAAAVKQGRGKVKRSNASLSTLKRTGHHQRE
jgi:uncharacterized protein YdaT